MEIFVSAPNDLDSQPQHSEKIKTINIAADATRYVKLERILNFIMYFNNADNLIIDDDYLRSHDPETIYFLKRLKEEKPHLNVRWTYALKIDGQHGR